MSEVLTGAETKKALECCINGKCSECPLRAMNCSAKVAMAFANDLINRQQANAEGLTNAVKFLNEQLSSAKAETVEKTRALFQAMVNKFMSIKDLYVIVDGEYLPWEPSEEVEHLFGMSISGDNDEIDKETDRVVKELVGDDNG